MGGSSSTTTQQSSTSPWAAAQPEVNGLLGQVGNLIPNSGATPAQTGAIAQLTANGQAGNPYAPQIGGVTTNLLNGGGATAQSPALQSNLTNYQAGLAPYTNPNYSTLNSPEMQAALSQIGTDTRNQIQSQFAAAGRSGSGMENQTLGRGIAAAEAPLILNQANTDTATRQAALGSLYGAGNTTAGAIAGLNQQGLANSQAGIGAADAALKATNWGPQSVIAAQQLGQSIPAQNLGLLAQIGIPLAQLGTNSNGTSNTQNQMSPVQMLSSLGGFGSYSPANATTGVGASGSGLLGLLGRI